MNTAIRQKALLLFFLTAFIALATPLTLRAEGTMADAQCVPAIQVCGCGMIMGPKGCIAGPNKWLCPCQDITNGGVTSGICIANFKCQGQSFSSTAGQAGGGLGMQQLMQALQGLMQGLQGGGGGGGGDSGGAYSGYPTQTGCSTFYQTSIQGNPDPCSYYVPDYGATTNSNFPSNNSSNAGCTSWVETSIQNDPNPCTFYVPAIPTGTYTSTTTSTGGTASSACKKYTATSIKNDPTPCTIYVPPASATGGTKTFYTGFLNGVVGISGFRGDISTQGSGSTVFGSVTDFQTNTGFAGFFGGSSFNSQGGGIAERLCTARPWANTFISILIKPTFFDNLCTSRGYGVGPKPAVVERVAQTVQSAITNAAQKVTQIASTTKPSGPYVPPQADIWASPASVSIGSRTSIFWNSKGVTSCLVTSPDGSFRETALQGGASTVPIVAATTFTISCTAPDGSHVTSNVTVTLRI